MKAAQTHDHKGEVDQGRKSGKCMGECEAMMVN